MARTPTAKSRPYPVRLKERQIKALEDRAARKGFRHPASYVKWKLFAEPDPVPPAAIVKLTLLREEIMKVSPLTAARVDEVLELLA